MNHNVLFEPISIGPVEIRNRLALAPTTTNFSVNHLAGDQTLAWCAARARGGLGLLIFETCPVSPMAAPTSTYNYHHFWGVEHISGMYALTSAVHAWGAKIFIQLTPGLGVQASLRGQGIKPKAPSAVNFKLDAAGMPESLIKWYMKFSELIPEPEGEVPEALTEPEIDQLVTEFARACKKAAFAGFDGVEVHSCHGYLIHDFLSPRYNKRTDDYGGSLENRMRFLMRLIEEGRQALPDSLAFGIRLSVDERTEDGIHFDEMKLVAAAAAKAGVDYLHLSDGCNEQSKYLLPDEDGTMLEGAQGFKQVVDIPVITPGLHHPDNAARAVEQGKTDVASSARAFIADPEWANKVREGRAGDIIECLRCNRCIFELFCGRPLRCSVNPKAGKERFELRELLGPAA